MDRHSDITRAIRQRDVAALTSLFFDRRPPELRDGYRTETELWDFKRDLPPAGAQMAPHWVGVAKDVLAFHNLHGGLIIFGIDNGYKTTFVRGRLDSKLVNEKLRRYLGDLLWCDFHREFIQEDQSYIGFLVVPPRGPQLLRFREQGLDHNGNVVFNAGDSALRQGDSSQILRAQDVPSYARRLSLPTMGRVYDVDQPYFRLLAPDYFAFVPRPDLTDQIVAALHDPRISVVSLLGIGGAGKTALATHAVLSAYAAEEYPFIASMTAKDRELTPTGIRGLDPTFSSYEALLDNVLDVLGFPDQKALPLEDREAAVRTLLKDSRGLLYVDNLETVDDARTIAFLDDLPVGVRAITTSRRTRVRVAAKPVEVGPLLEGEVLAFVRSLQGLPGLAYVSALHDPEIQRIGNACDRLPLAIRWALARAKSAKEALANAESITRSGRRGEELLEFSFRRVFESLSPEERRVLEVAALFTGALSTEAIIVGAGTTPGTVTDPRVLDAIDDLVEDALIMRVYDPTTNDYAVSLLPITRAFVVAELSKSRKRADEIRARLTNYFEATDIRDTAARLVVREARQGRAEPETSLLDLAIGAENRGDLSTAESLYQQALSRNPRSWRVARKYAEFARHRRQNLTEALNLYEQAANHAPSRGPDRALIFREWGMLLRDAGMPDATTRAIACFEEALADTPNDEVAIHALGTMLIRTGAYQKAVALLEPLLDSKNRRSREASVRTLLQAYDRLGDRLKAQQLKDRAPSLGVVLTY